jgi:hypothetical protein
MIKSVWLRWARYAAHMGEKTNVYRILVGNVDGKKYIVYVFFV